MLVCLIAFRTKSFAACAFVGREGIGGELIETVHAALAEGAKGTPEATNYVIFYILHEAIRISVGLGQLVLAVLLRILLQMDRMC